MAALVNRLSLDKGSPRAWQEGAFVKVGITSDKWPTTVVHEADGKVQIELRESDGVAIIEIEHLRGLASAEAVSPTWGVTFLYRSGAWVDWTGPSLKGCGKDEAEKILAKLSRCPRCGRDDGHQQGCPIGEAARGPGGLQRIQ